MAVPNSLRTMKTVKKFRIIALIAAAFSMVLAGTVVYIAKGGETVLSAKGDQSAYWSKRWLACEDKTLLTTEAVLEHSYDCLKIMIRDAVTTNNFDPMAEAAWPILDKNIELAYTCHIPGHDLGLEFVRYFKNDYPLAIRTLNANICGSGIVHGIYDVWGKEKHTLAEWIKVGNACIQANLIRYNACGDAIGHSAYESLGEDLAGAIGICNEQAQMWIRNACANGAFMQSQYPQSSALKATREANMPDDWADLIKFCDSLPYSNDGTMDGCYGGAGWVMGNTIFKEMNALATLPDERLSNPAQDKAVVERIRYATDACNATKGSNKGNPMTCEALMLARMPLFFYLNIPKFIDFCQKVGAKRDYEFLIQCLASGQEHISAEQKQEIWEQFPEAEQAMRDRNPRDAGLISNQLG